MKEILNVIHNTIYQFFDVCGDDEEVPMSDKDKLLLEVNKAICNNLKALKQQPCEDCISREALIEKATSWDRHFADSERCVSLTDIQNAPSVTPKAEQKAVLDKIRAEIEQITDTMGVSYNQYVSKIDVLQIIDKYKAESGGE